MARAINAANIKDTLTTTWRNVATRTYCNFFLRDVGRDFGIQGLDQTANSQIEMIMRTWKPVPTAAAAANEAATGAFVVAVLRGGEHADHRPDGHVAIVLPGPLQPRGAGATGGAYPFVWCGGTGVGQSDGTRTVGDVWRPADRNHVHYYKYEAAN